MSTRRSTPSRRARGVIALAVAGAVGAGAYAAQHSMTPAASTTAAATTSSASSTSSGQATLQSAASAPASSAVQTPVAASGGS